MPSQRPPSLGEAIARAAASGALHFAYSIRRSPELVLWYGFFPLIFLLGAKFLFFTGPGVSAGLYPPEADAASALEEAGFRVVAYSSLEEMLEDLANGRILVAVVAGGSEPRALYSLENARGLALLALKAVRGEPLGSGAESLEKVEPGPFAEPRKALAVYSVMLVGMTTLYTGLYGGLVSIVHMRADGSLRVIASAPRGAASLIAYLTGFN